MRKWIKQFQMMTLDRKIKLLLTMGIIISASIVLTISTISSISSITTKSKSMVKTNVETVSKSLDSIIRNYYNITLSLIPDEDIQLYLKKNTGDRKYDAARESSMNSLSKVMFQQEDINFIALHKSEKEYIYRGQGITKSKFVQMYASDLDNSIPWGRGHLRISYDDAYFGESNYTISLYQPVYDMYKLGTSIGYLCINLNEDVFGFLNNQVLGDSKFDMYLTDKSGNVIFCENKELLGTSLEFKRPIIGSSGSFSDARKLHLYQKIDSSDLYVMGTIDNFTMVKDSFITMLLLIVTVMVIVGIALIMVSKVVKMYYEPMENLVVKMDQVSRGNLDIRMDEIHSGADFATISRGFNHMMEEINQLMEQVKLEQHQIEQIKFNALQSQIKPHFLYNTLDCIHWQAATEGNKEISVLVKALANYYRACLSKGKDVITLGEELEHIKSYLIIQNIRYENILESKFCIGEEYLNVKIPKMTLQPLIENAIYHGMKIKSGKKGIVVLNVAEDHDMIILSVIDNGHGMSEAEINEMNRSISEYDENFGYGIRNVNKRLELLFGEQYGLHYVINSEGGITVNIRLPKPYQKNGK